VLLARLVEDARSSANAELALFRTDFYRRIARARIGALLLLLGAIMGQAAAVTFLVTLSFVLTPYVGRLVASLIAVVGGAALAVWLIRLGVRKLIMVVEDFEEDEEQRADVAAKPLDQLFERVRQRSRDAREQLRATLDDTQARLHPQMLMADLADELVDNAQQLADRVIDSARRRPARAFTLAAAIVLLVVRQPLGRVVAKLFRATASTNASLVKKRLGPNGGQPNEEMNP